MSVLEKILEEIEEMRDIMKSTVATNCFGKECEHNDCTVCVCERAMEIIRSHMDDVENNGWIPVSERLPEKAGTYIVSAKDGKREIVTFVKWQNRFKKWDLSGARAYWKTNAWKPLPEPYRGE